MGCTNTVCAVYVMHESGEKHTNQPLTSYKALRSWINSSFPDLSQKPYKIQTDSVPSQVIKNSRDYLQIYSKHSGRLNLKVLLDKPKRYKPEIFEKLSNWIFKVRKEGEDVEATGFMLSPKMCLVGIKDNHFQYHALFEDGSTLQFKADGPVVILQDFSLLELEVTNEWISKHMSSSHILLDCKSTPIKLIMFYYSKSRPILQEFILENPEVSKESFNINPKSISSATPGSPLFSDSGHLIGVYHSQGKAIRSHHLIQEIESNFPNLDKSFQETLEETVILSGITLHKSSPSTDDSWKNMSVFLDTEKSSLVLSSEDLSQGSLEARVAAKSGSSVAVTPFGILISGQDDQGDRRKAWIFDGKTMQNIRNMKKHVNHSSIFFKSKVFVVSGSSTASVETYDFQLHDWQVFNALPKKRSCTSLAVVSDQLFLVGGVKNKQKLSKSILVLNDLQWEKLRVSLPAPLAGLAVFKSGSKSLVLFGGFSEGHENNSKLWKLNLSREKIKEICIIKLNSIFGSFPVTYSEDLVTIYSNTGNKVQINPISLSLFP
jgi:hypothetical protein